MTKNEIFDKLENLNLDKDKYIVLSGASLVVQGIIDETHDIDLSCSNSYFSTIDWDYLKIGKILPGASDKIKCFDVFEIGTNFYYTNDIVKINGYNFLSIEKCLEFKKLFNRKKDKKVIEKIDMYLCNLDNYRYERKLKEKGINLIAGVDEVGRGPLVGPVVAAAVILPDDYSLEGLTDSKKLSEKKRDYFYDLIMKQATSVGIGVISEKIIDDVNIYEATKLAMIQAINNLDIKPEHILIDAMPLDMDIPTTSIIKGDLKSITISAASVIAKVTRDRMLDELDKNYPMYDFKSNKGYPTKKHMDAIDEYGIIDEHRRSYAPVSNYIKYGKTRV